MQLLLLLFTIIFPFVFVPGYHNYVIYKFGFLSFFTILLWIMYVVQIVRGNVQLKLKPYIAEILLLLFLVLVSVSTTFSVDLNKSLFGEAGRHEGFPMFLAYGTLFLFVVRTIKVNRLHIFINSFIMIAFLIGIYAILQHYLIDPLPRIPFKNGWTRSYGFFGNPNFYGSYLTLMLPFSMVFYILADQKRKEIFYLLASATLFIALLYSQTRSGWVGSCFGYVFLTITVIWKRRKLWKKWILMSIVFFCVFAFVNVSSERTVSNRINHTVQQTTNVVKGEEDAKRLGSHRVYIWVTALPLIEDYWLVGSGPDTFGTVFPNGTEYERVYFDKAHNEYLQIGLTLGIPALIMYLLFLFEIIKNNVRWQNRLDDRSSILSLMFMASILGYIIQAFFNISVISVTPYFFIVLGLSYGFSHHIKETSTVFE